MLWIRMRQTLLKNPRVLRMARSLAADAAFAAWFLRSPAERFDQAVNPDVLPAFIVGVLLQVWTVAGELSQAGFLSLATLEDLDVIAGVPSFGKALAECGWAQPSADPPGLLLPNFEEWNQSGGDVSRQPEQRRAPLSDAERSRRHRRRKKRNVADAPDVAPQDGADGPVTGRHETVTERHEIVTETVTGGRDEIVTGGGIYRGVSEQNRTEQREGVRARDADPKKTFPEKSFETFWAAYPRKAKKAEALKAWKRLSPDAALVEAMLAALEVQKQSEQWTKDGPQFIPFPATWLHQRRWEDEPPQAETFQDRLKRLRTERPETTREKVERISRERREREELRQKEKASPQ